MKRKGLFSLSLLVLLAASPYLMGFLEEPVKALFTGDFTVTHQANLDGGWKTGSYSFATTGAATVGAVTATSVNSTGAVSGTTGSFTSAVTGVKSIITVTTDTTLTAAQCRGTVVYCSTADSDSTVTLTMPTLAAGYDVTFIDNDLTAGADMEIQMGTGDKVNGGTAAKMLKHTGTAVGAVHLVAVDDTDFVEVSTPTDSSNWANDNN